jgi:hypothetical protein
MYNQKLKAPQTLAIQLIKRNNNTLMAIFQDRCFVFKLKSNHTSQQTKIMEGWFGM